MFRFFTYHIVQTKKYDTMLSPDDVFIECNDCGSNDANNDVEIDVPDKKSKDYVPRIFYYCDECYSERFGEE